MALSILETVVPFREALGKPAGYTAYLGGVDTHMSTLPGFVGCLRGVKLAGTVLNLHKSSYHLDGTDTLFQLNSIMMLGFKHVKFLM